MPQGKGTYGSQVGRPKKKYNKGGNVDPFSTRNPEGVPAKQIAEAMEKQNMAKSMEDAIPTSNAMERSQVSPDTEQYKDGGPVSPVGNKEYEAKKGQKSTLMRNKPKKEYELKGLLAVEKKKPKGSDYKSKPKKKKAKAENIAAIDKAKLRKELKQVDPSGRGSKKSKKFFDDDSSGRA